MRRLLLILCSCFLIQSVGAQYLVHTVVPQKEVASGGAFQVQYVVQQSDKFLSLKAPLFSPNFQLISGPRIYRGFAMVNKVKVPIQNFTYTLMPLAEGRLLLKGATAIYKNAIIKGDDAEVVVSKKGSASQMDAGAHPPTFSATTLEEKIGEYLFIKTDINKKETYVGQPVVVTFTLYSRLESLSEIIKNPGFYGFGVVEMTRSEEQQQSIEIYKNRLYNTHLIRKLQLYPLQAGKLVIDEMLMNNKVVYTDSLSGQPTKSEVVIGSVPTTLIAKSLPVPPPENFTGAVGQFSIEAFLVQQKLPLNKEGQLEIIIKGSGNFMELTALSVLWPKGLTGFDALEKDELQKETIPLTGRKVYTYHFTADSMGTYAFSPINFSYFDPQQKRYKTVVASPPLLIVMPKEKATIKAAIVKNTKQHYNLLLILFAIIFTAVGSILIYKKRKKISTIKQDIITPHLRNYKQKIQAINGDSKVNYIQLQQLLTEAIVDTYHIRETGSAHKLLQQLEEKKVPRNIVEEVAFLLEQCEAVLYFNAAAAIPFDQLKQRAAAVIVIATI